jgi:hypothetical protein
MERSVSSAERRERRPARVGGWDRNIGAHYSVPPGRTARLGEKFGRISAAFKTTFFASRNRQAGSGNPRIATQCWWHETRDAPNRQFHGEVCNSIVPRRAPVVRSMIRSCRPPSGSASTRTRRSVPAAIASIRAPRAISIAEPPNARAVIEPDPLRDILTATTAIRTVKPTMSIMPMTTTRILSPRIPLMTDDA